MENKFSGQIPPDVNPSQWQAITHSGSHLLIIAGPGTGKTHTLIYRISHLLQNLEKEKGKKVLAITFTNKAAEEMRERLSRRIPDIDRCVSVGTFHQFCRQILREHIIHTTLPQDFRVASPDEIEEIIRDLWPTDKPKGRKLFLIRISDWKSKGFEGDPPVEVGQYNRELRERGWLDFDDLLLETLLLLRGKEEVLQQIRNVFPYICVDEYQDINAVQHALLKILVGPRGTLTAIGDPNQAIYGFRGSDVKFFSSFAQDFSTAKILSLSENYRSGQNILSASSQVIAKSANEYVPELTARIYREGKLTIHQTATDRAEAEYVVQQIEKMVGGTSMFSQDSRRVAGEGSDYSFGDIAVLYRLNSQFLVLQEAFDRSGIPYQVSGLKPSDDPEEWINDFLYQRNEGARIQAEKVSLMTLHASKGLEFPCVFIVGCEEDLLPLHLEGLTADREEERRLFYVGMTRAKERLFLLHAKRRRLYGKTRQPNPSPFLADIEEKLKEYEKVSSRQKKRKQEQMNLF